MFGIAFVMILAVVFVNGATDAANAIATAVGTGAMRMKNAAIMSAFMNFTGVCIGGLFRPRVADSLYNIILISDDRNLMLIFVISSMVTVFLWAGAAWYFALPTSESHALIASLTGCAVAICDSFDAINADEIYRAVFGLIFSVFVGFMFAFIMQKLLKKKLKIKTSVIQIGIAAMLSLLHGAQDGQKFLGICMLLFSSISEEAFLSDRIMIIIVCALLMGLGTVCGGGRIVHSVGENIIPLNGSQGVISDLSACVGMALSTYAGYPVSTTHIKTMSIVGVGVAEKGVHLNVKLISSMLLAWLITFPACFLIGCVVAKLFLLCL